jgi:hypothetical protein
MCGETEQIGKKKDGADVLGVGLGQTQAHERLNTKRAQIAFGDLKRVGGRARGIDRGCHLGVLESLARILPVPAKGAEHMVHGGATTFVSRRLTRAGDAAGSGSRHVANARRAVLETHEGEVDLGLHSAHNVSNALA